MATYDGYISDVRKSFRPYQHFTLAGFYQGRSRLSYDWAESGSGSYPSGDYPSGVAALGIPVIEIAGGGYVIIYAALDVLQTVSVPVYANAQGKCGIRIQEGPGGEVLAHEKTSKDNEWEYISATLPSGYPKGIYMVQLANFAIQQSDDARAWFGPIEVI